MGLRALPARPLAFAAPAGAHLTYYGGRVVSNMQVVQVLYGTGSYLPQVSSTSSPSMATFYQGVLNSPYVDWLTEYNTNIIAAGGTPGTNQTHRPRQFRGPVHHHAVVGEQPRDHRRLEDPERACRPDTSRQPSPTHQRRSRQ